MPATVTVSTDDGQPVRVEAVNATTGDLVIPHETVPGFTQRTFYVNDTCDLYISAIKADD